MAGTCAATGKEGFSYLGRRDKAVSHRGQNGETLLISPMLLNAILDEFPDIAIRPHSFLGNIGLASAIGFQKWHIDAQHVSGITRVELQLELTWSSLQFREAAARLVAELERRLIAAFSALSEFVRAGAVKFTIKLFEPGSTGVPSDHLSGQVAVCNERADTPMRIR